MTFSLIGHASASSTTNATTTGFDTTGSDLLVAVISNYANAVGITDSYSNNWVLLGRLTTATTTQSALFVAVAPTVGTGHTFSTTGAQFSAICVEAWSGSKAASTVLDKNSGASATQAGAFTPTQNNELVIAACGPADSTSATAVGGGFTISDNQSYVSGATEGGALAYLVQTTAASVNPTWTVSGGTPNSLLASFQTNSTPTLVAHTSADGQSNGGTSSAIDTTGANLLVAMISGYTPYAYSANIADNKGNSWAQIGSTLQTGTVSTNFFCTTAPFPIVGAGHQFGIASGSGISFATVCVQAWSGMATPSPFDKFSDSLATQAGSITPSAANSLVVAAIGTPDAQSATAIGSSFTISDNVAYGAGNNEGAALAYLVQTTATAENPTWTVSGGTPGTYIASFLAAGGGSIGSGAGSSAGTATVSGVGAALAAATGTSAGTATVSGVLAAIAKTVGSAAGTSTVSGVAPGGSTISGTGTSAGTSTVSGVGVTARVGAGTSAGTATVSGVGVALVPAAGTSAGTATVSGVLRALAAATGSSTASAAASGVSAAIAASVGTIAASSTASGVGQAKLALTRSFNASIT